MVFGRPTVVRSALSATSLKPSLTRRRSDEEWRKILSPTRFAVLREARTEPRGITIFDGGFDDHFVPNGTYLCGACDSPLYSSEMKFDCGCGWPGFWTNLPNAVAERPDGDNSGRTEIVCSECESHLGHLFRGERFNNPEPNERHCVNSVSLKFKNRDGTVTVPTYDGQVY